MVNQAGSLGQSYPAGYTRYASPMGESMNDFGQGESRMQFIARGSYTLSKLSTWSISPNTLTVIATIRSRKNGIDGTQVISIPALASGSFEDAVNSDSLVAGDLFDTSIVTPAGSGSIYLRAITYVLASATSIPILGASYDSNTIGFGVTRYVSISGSAYSWATEAQVQYLFRAGATLSNFRVRVRSNTLNGASTARTRVNGANGNQSVSIGAGATGAFEDAVNTDVVAVGNLVNYQFIAGGSAGSFQMWFYQVKSVSGGRQLIISTSNSYNFGLTRCFVMEGSTYSTAAADAGMSFKANAIFSAKNLYLYLSGNSINGISTFTLRKNAADTTLTVSIPASTSGAFEDTTHVVALAATDLINWRLVTGGTSGSLALTIAGCELGEAASAGGGKGDSLLHRLLGVG